MHPVKGVDPTEPDFAFVRQFGAELEALIGPAVKDVGFF
jgi:hypothetical protein